MVKKFKKFDLINEEVNNEISTNDLYVVKSYSSIDVNSVYKIKSDAQKECDKQNEEWYSYNRVLHKTMSDSEFDDYFKPLLNTKKVLTLYDAIDEIIEYTRDECDNPSWNEPGY